MVFHFLNFYRNRSVLQLYMHIKCFDCMHSLIFSWPLQNNGINVHTVSLHFTKPSHCFDYLNPAHGCIQTYLLNLQQLSEFILILHDIIRFYVWYVRGRSSESNAYHLKNYHYLLKIATLFRQFHFRLFLRSRGI